MGSGQASLKMFRATGERLVAAKRTGQFRSTGPALVVSHRIIKFRATGPELTAGEPSTVFRATGPALTAIARHGSFRVTGPALSAVSRIEAFRATGAVLVAINRQIDFMATGPELVVLSKVRSPDQVIQGQDETTGDTGPPCQMELACKTAEELRQAAHAISLISDLSPADPAMCAQMEQLLGACDPATSGIVGGVGDGGAGSGVPQPDEPVDEDNSDLQVARCLPFETHVLNMNRRSMNGEDISQEEAAVERAVTLSLPVLLQGDTRAWCETLMGHLTK